VPRDAGVKIKMSDEAQSLAQRFDAMSERIKHNELAPFGGACVIVPPENGGEPIELLMLDASADPAQFWSTIATRLQIVLKNLEDSRRTGQAFGMR